MSLLIHQLAAWLEAEGEGTVGTDIFRFQRPSSPVACVSVHPTGGYPPDRYTERELPTVMLFARAASPDGALEKAYSLFNRLHGCQGLDFGGGIFALTIEAIGSPQYVGDERADNQSALLSSFNIMLDLRRPSS